MDEEAGPLFPFGYGLGYGTFEWGACSLSTERCNVAALENKGLTIRFSVKIPVKEAAISYRRLRDGRCSIHGTESERIESIPEGMAGCRTGKNRFPAAWQGGILPVESEDEVCCGTWSIPD